MGFLKFVLGGFLVLGSIILFIILLFGWPFAIIGGATWTIAFWGVIDFIMFLSGIYLLKSH